MSAHTPGPWVTGGDNDSTAILSSVSWVQVAMTNEAVSEYEANARLIAASPTMLVALQRIHANGYTTSGDYDMVLAAITEATGEPA